jgi:tetratricopeptide (TPR) repeat protein
MTQRSDTFGRLLKAGLNSIASIEGKTGPTVDEEIGALLGLAGTSLQRYRAGAIPEQRGVAVLAEQCIVRGLMGRAWLERVLKAAQYPPFEARALAARLFPEAVPPATHKPSVRINLPPPSYARFVMRRAAFDAVLAGLRGNLSATSVVSLGGMGKTSLARAVAGACLEGREDAPRFAAVAWASDQDRPGTTNLSTLLDLIARVLDHPGVAGMAHSDKLAAVDQLLREQPMLIVVDNAETISDGALLEWLARLPAPSKALVTSRVVLPALANACLVELEPMDLRESRELLAIWLEHSRLRMLPDALDQLSPITLLAGGNPKAIELALGLVQRRSLGKVLEGLASASIDELFDALFARAWLLLDASARRVLLAMPLFPASAPAAALGFVADLPPGAVQRVADQLADLSLLDVARTDLLSPPRYAVHPLVRAFASARLLESAEAATLRARWLAWCSDLAASVGFCWDDLDRLDTLDAEHETLQAALEWAEANGHDAEVLALVEGLRYFYNVRGFWDEARLRNNVRRVAAARRLGDRDEEVLGLAHQAEILSKQGRLDEASVLLDQLRATGEAGYAARLAQPQGEAVDTAALSDDAAFEYGHALGLYARAVGDLAGAEAQWRALLPLAEELGGQKYVVNRRWLATVLLQQGRRDEAQALYAAALADARRINDTRSITGNTLKLAAIALDQGDLEVAARALAECRAVATRYQDRRRLAECHRLFGRLYAVQGDSVAARVQWEQAADLFTRMGMQREAAELAAEIDG